MWKTKNNINQKEVAKMLMQIGLKLINDLSKEDNQNITLSNYGEGLLKDFPLLLEIQKIYKKGVK